MNSLTIIQRIRNKIKTKGKNNNIIVDNKKSLNLTGNNIYIKGNDNILHIMPNTTIKNTTIEIIGNNCSVVIGSNCMVGYNCYLSAKEDNSNLIIKDNCGLSRNIKIMTSDGHDIYKNNIRINKAKDIIINNNVWIADSVTILKGVDIGSGSVIGINSVVTKSIPNNSISAGNPAKIIKENINWKA